VSDLPPGWEWATLGEVLERIEAGKSFSGDGRPATPGEWGVIKVSAMTYGQFREGENKAVRADTVFSESAEIKPGDLLLSRANTRDYVGASVLVGNCRPRLLLSDKSLRLIPTEAVDRRWLWYALQSPTSRQYMSNASSGVKAGMRNISQASLQAMPLPIPPVTEQCRIVAALERHLSRLAAGTSSLRSAERRIKAASNAELRRIVDSYADSSWTRLGDVSTGQQYGTSIKCSYAATGRPVLRIPNIQSGEIDLADMKYATNDSEELEDLRIRAGDTLFVRTNGSKSLIGRLAVARNDLQHAFASYLIRFRFDQSVAKPEWVQLVLSSPHLRRQIETLAASSAGQYNLSISKLSGLEIPVPSIADQTAAVNEFRNFQARLGRLATGVAANQLRAQRLRQCLFTDAIAGHLVQQDPNDEPPSVLLERSRAERAAQHTLKRGRRTRQVVAVQEALL
jgi:type I restriction enzyme, S subunit